MRKWCRASLRRGLGPEDCRQLLGVRQLPSVASTTSRAAGHGEWQRLSGLTGRVANRVVQQMEHRGVSVAEANRHQHRDLQHTAHADSVSGASLPLYDASFSTGGSHEIRRSRQFAGRPAGLAQAETRWQLGQQSTGQDRKDWPNGFAAASAHHRT